MPDEKKKGEFELPAQPALIPIANVDPVYATTFSLQGSGNDFTIVFQRLRPLLHPEGGKISHHAVAEIVSVVTMSPQSLRDLKELVDDAVTEYEKDFNKIETKYIRSKAQVSKS